MNFVQIRILVLYAYLRNLLDHSLRHKWLLFISKVFHNKFSLDNAHIFPNISFEHRQSSGFNISCIYSSNITSPFVRFFNSMNSLSFYESLGPYQNIIQRPFIQFSKYSWNHKSTLIGYFGYWGKVYSYLTTAVSI